MPNSDTEGSPRVGRLSFRQISINDFGSSILASLEYLYSKLYVIFLFSLLRPSQHLVRAGESEESRNPHGDPVVAQMAFEVTPCVFRSSGSHSRLRGKAGGNECQHSPSRTWEDGALCDARRGWYIIHYSGTARPKYGSPLASLGGD